MEESGRAIVATDPPPCDALILIENHTQRATSSAQMGCNALSQRFGGPKSVCAGSIRNAYVGYMGGGGSSMGYPHRKSSNSHCGRRCNAKDVWDAPFSPDLAPACLLNALFRPSVALGRISTKSSAQQQQPSNQQNTFDELTAAMGNNDTLAIAIYARIGNAEFNHLDPDNATTPHSEQEGIAEKDIEDQYRYWLTALCALQLEERWSTGFQKVLWVVVSDDASFADKFIERFDDSGGSSGRRRVVPGIGRGLHSAPTNQNRKHNGSAVSEAIADWWLLGEADLGIVAPITSSSNHNSFGRSGFVRGGRTRSIFAVPSSACVGVGSRGNLAWDEGCKNETAETLVRCGDENNFAPIWREGRSNW